MQSPQKDQSSPSKTTMEAPQDRPNPLTMRINALRLQCEIYRNSFPGRSSLAPNTAFNGITQDFLDGQYDNDEKILEMITKMVSYRNTLTRRATELLTLAEIPKPNGLDCAQFDFHAFQDSQSYRDKEAKYHHAFRQVARIDRSFFPPPEVKKEARPFVKPVQYVAAALTLDDATDSSEEIAAAVQRIKLSYEKMLVDKTTKEVDNVPEVS